MHRRPLLLSSVAAAVAFSALAAGCGGGSSAGGAGAASGTSAATTTVRYGAAGAQAGALAFARCMRAHGIPNWPDPDGSGGFDKTKLQQLGISAPRVRAIEQRSCNYDFQNGRGQGHTITAADRSDYLEAAACMRRHGFPAFPDPTFRNDSVELNVPSSLDSHSAGFESAATTCSKLIPAGLPYSHPGGS